MNLRLICNINGFATCSAQIDLRLNKLINQKLAQKIHTQQFLFSLVIFLIKFVLFLVICSILYVTENFLEISSLYQLVHSCICCFILCIFYILLLFHISRLFVQLFKPFNFAICLFSATVLEPITCIFDYLSTDLMRNENPVESQTVEFLNK